MVFCRSRRELRLSHSCGAPSFHLIRPHLIHIRRETRFSRKLRRVIIRNVCSEWIFSWFTRIRIKICARDRISICHSIFSLCLSWHSSAPKHIPDQQICMRLSMAVLTCRLYIEASQSSCLLPPPFPHSLLRFDAVIPSLRVVHSLYPRNPHRRRNEIETS